MSSSSIIPRARVRGQAWLVGVADDDPAAVADDDPHGPVTIDTGQTTREREIILEQARREAEEVRQAAWQEGYRQGEVEGREAVAREAEAILRRLVGIAEGARVETTGWLRATEDEVVALALEVARKVVGTELAANHDAVVQVVRTSLAGIDAGTVLRLRVSPDDWDALTAWWAGSISEEQRREIELLADPAIPGGGCVIETRTGGRDARTGSRLAEVAQALLREAEVPR